ncbi:MAG: hypothetical protein HQL71_09635 [Magnetococcales bacterium]|nr:hypothetical protein [Magnetococcales bacterium]
MKSADSIMPIILLELIAGIILISVILLSVVIIEDRLALLSLPSKTTVSAPASAVTTSPFMYNFTLALKDLEKKVDTLSAPTKAVLPSLATPSQDKIDKILQKRIDEITPKFENLEHKMQRFFAPRQDLKGITLKAVEGAVPLSPIVGELQKKVDFLSLEHEKTVTPTLTTLTDKIDQLLMARAKSIALQVEEENSHILYDDDVVDDDIWDNDSDRVNPDIFTLARDKPVIDVVKPTPVIKPFLVDKNITVPAIVEPPVAEPMVASTLSNFEVTKRVKNILAHYGIESTIDLRNNGLQLPPSFDFRFGSSELSEKQVAKTTILADALAEVFLCYANTKDKLIMEKCQQNSDPFVLNSVLLKVFSVGSNVGSERFKYNWDLATSRSINVLKVLVTARPELLTYTNTEGDSLFQTMAELPKTGAKRTRRMELQFNIPK